MLSPQQIKALKTLLEQARASDHIFPEYATCEAVLETAWGTSELFRDYRNVFGEKQSEHPIFWTVKLSTKEHIGDRDVTVLAPFVWFPTIADSFTARMQLLERLAGTYPEYAAALHATSGEEFVGHVSKRWSTDPLRAQKVLIIYGAHRDVLEAV